MKICSECRRCFDDVVEQCSEWHGQLSLARPGSVSMISGYRIEERLYTGLRGDLFRATRTDCGRSCLIRVIGTDQETGKRFLDAAKIVADLYHPNLTAIFESGTTEAGEAFVVSEHPTEGETLRDWLDRSGPLELLESIRIVRMIAETLHEPHQAGVVFRALNPDNILVSNVAGGEAQIRLQNIDLGGAVQHAIISNKFLIDTETAAIKYFSPEQCADEPTTARSDVYSLGVLLYELIAGFPPFDADRAAGVIEQHRHVRPPEIKIHNFDLRMLISHTLMESLSKRPEGRQSSADLFARQLRHIEQLATHVPTPAPVVKVASSPVKQAPRVITLAESGLDLPEPAQVDPISPLMVSEPSIVRTPSNDHLAAVPARRHVTIPPEPTLPSLRVDSIDPEGIKQIDFRAARERMKDLLATTPAAAPPKLVRLDEPLDDVPSIGDTLAVLGNEGDSSPEFHAAADYSTDSSTSPADDTISDSVVPGVDLTKSATFIGPERYLATPMTDALPFPPPSGTDEDLFASIESFSAVRFARLRRGIAIGAAAGLVALAFTFRADILETFTPYDLGKLEPPPYRPAASAVKTSEPQPTNIIYSEPTQYEPAETVTEPAVERPTAGMITGNGPSREERPVTRKVSAKASEPKPAEPIPSRQKPETYKPENLVITYPDPRTRKANNDRDPFVKPKSGPGMTRPRIVANPKP